MGMCLIATTSMQGTTDLLLVILQVAIGLGAVIFVHELGHFAVAKMCGVKCEKFFVGFDIGGYKLSRKIGETEYGIGILPLGGYVKMLGQDDNPANIAEQMRESQVTGDSGEDIETKEIIGPDGKTYLVDRRSYLAKSVPQRMAIISAGVIMNVIFALVFAVVAFGIGVPYLPCIVAETSPGSPAWQAGIHTGDEIVRIADTVNPNFSDLQGGIALGDLDSGIECEIRRPGVDATETITLHPEQGSGLAKVGIFSSYSLRLREEYPFRDDSAASKASPPLEGGDEIIAIEGKPITAYRELVAAMVAKPSEPLKITVRRGGKPPKDNRFGPRVGGEEIEVTVPPRPMRRLGLVMEWGKVVAVEKGSSADQQGVRPDDFIDRVQTAEDMSASAAAEQGWELRDPVTLPEELRRLASKGRDVRLTIRHTGPENEGRQTTEVLPLSLREVTWMDSSIIGLGDPLSAPALGIAYRVLNRVAGVRGNPAMEAGLQGGDVITQAEFILPEGTEGPDDEDEDNPIKFGGEENHNWPAMIETLQLLPAGTKVKLTYKRGDEEPEAELTPEESEEFFLADRGFFFEPYRRIRTASSFKEQVVLGFDQTKKSLGMVFRFLSKLGTQVPITTLGGPITIAKAAGSSAFNGVGSLLVFLTMLSANLAVINFLPIPLLDGGHMVFLAWEGITGKPASEKFVVALHTLGFVFIITLMLFVIGLDFGLIPRGL